MSLSSTSEATDAASSRPSILGSSAWGEAQATARALAPSWDARTLLARAMALSDAMVVLLTALLAWLIRHGTSVPQADVAYAVLLAVAMTFNAMQFFGAYRQHATESFAAQLGPSVRAWLLVSLALFALGFLTKTFDSYSRLWMIIWCVLALGGFAAVRALAVAQVGVWQQRGRLARTVAVVDLSGEGEAWARRLRHESPSEFHLVGVFGAQRQADRKDGVEDLVALSRVLRVDEILVAVSPRACTGDTQLLIRRLGTIPANVRICAVLPDLGLIMRSAEIIGGQPAVTVYQRPLSGLSSVVKRAEDLVLGSLMLVLVAPTALLIALAIRLDSPGPVLFRQRRNGFNNNTFTVFKFRTMVHRAEDEMNVPQARRNDPRVTRVGRILRQTSLDELPQILNVLRGEMSLVGPRPHALAHNEQYGALIDDYLGRHRVQPGITGWAQVHGLRGETETLDQMRQRVAYDLVYIDNWSIFLDIRILFLTVLTVLFHRNAY